MEHQGLGPRSHWWDDEDDDDDDDNDDDDNDDDENMMPGPLRHPAYVYAATFHPATASIIVTGGFDRVLRVWRREDGGTYTVAQVSCLAG